MLSCIGGFASSEEFISCHEYLAKSNDVNSLEYLSAAELLFDAPNYVFQWQNKTYQATDQSTVENKLQNAVRSYWHGVVQGDNLLKPIFAKNFKDRWPTPATLWSYNTTQSKDIISHLLGLIMINIPDILSTPINSMTLESMQRMAIRDKLAIHLLMGICRYSKNLGILIPKTLSNIKEIQEPMTILKYVQERRQYFSLNVDKNILGIKSTDNSNKDGQIMHHVLAMQQNDNWRELVAFYNKQIKSITIRFGGENVPGTREFIQAEQARPVLIRADLGEVKVKFPEVPVEKRKMPYKELVLYQYEIPLD